MLTHDPKGMGNAFCEARKLSVIPSVFSAIHVTVTEPWWFPLPLHCLCPAWRKDGTRYDPGSLHSPL